MSSRSGRPSIIAGFLALCFTAIIMYVLIGVLLLTQKAGGTERIIFAILNCLILVSLTVLGNTVARLSSFATTVQLWCVTVLYTILQFGAVFIGINSWYGSSYVLYQLIVFFVYMCIALPVFNISYKKNSQKES